MRQIVINETNTNLLYIYFQVFLIDGKTPATGEADQQPEVNINGSGWTSAFIGLLQDQNFGYYRALLTSDAVSAIGFIFSHYKSDHTIDSYGEPIEIVNALAQVPIFGEENLNIIGVTYANFNEAESYFSTRLGSLAWEDAPQDDKIKSLMMGTRDINRLNFTGRKAKEDQPLEFPRTYRRDFFHANHYLRPFDEVGWLTYHNSWNAYENIPNPTNRGERSECIIPDDIKIANCEIAIKYLEGIDIEEEMKNLNVDTQRFSAIHETYSHSSTLEAYRAGINSLKAWTYLRPYLGDPQELKLKRVQ